MVSTFALNHCFGASRLSIYRYIVVSVHKYEVRCPARRGYEYLRIAFFLRAKKGNEDAEGSRIIPHSRYRTISLGSKCQKPRNSIDPLLSNIPFFLTLAALLDMTESMDGRHAVDKPARRLRGFKRIEQSDECATRLRQIANSTKCYR